MKTGQVSWQVHFRSFSCAVTRNRPGWHMSASCTGSWRGGAINRLRWARVSLSGALAGAGAVANALHAYKRIRRPVEVEPFHIGNPELIG